ncbi:MAG: mechanosensitive ion channel [Oscillatoriaceae cyanobacterium Prado104]|nr:mechanosensitive ion channel [Oscillatoriaceae cyanobacterium Prado104]
MPGLGQKDGGKSSDAKTSKSSIESLDKLLQPPPKGDPKAAVTTKEPDIPVEELRLLIKPFSLDELRDEAAGWQLLLKNKVKEISDAEIAIKRQNRSIDKQKEAATSLDEAQKALEEADKALKSAAPNSAEHKEATKKAEEAKEKLKKAQEGLKEATETKQELKQDNTLNEALKKAEKTGEVDLAKQTLDTAKQERDKIPPNSEAYTAATAKIDELDKAIKAYEDAEKAQKAIADPKSPEYQEATKKIEETTAQVKKAREAISGAPAAGTDAAEKSAQKLDEAASSLEQTKIQAGGATPSPGAPVPGNTPGSLDQKGQQLENTADKLEENAKDEAALKNQLVVNATNLQSGRTAIVDRLNVILEELDRKGGDSASSRKYIEAVTKAEIDVKDTEGLGVRLISWFKSEEGGLRWAGNIGKFVGIILASAIVSQVLGLAIGKLLQFSKTSKLLRQFIVILINRGGIVVGVLLALTALEVSLAPVLAVVGGASFVIAFALQSNIGNFASGLMLLVYKPFDVGDEVDLGGVYGWVDSITLANTKIKTLAVDMITVPNNTVWGGKIINYSHAQIRRIQMEIRINFGVDIVEVRKILVDVTKSHPEVLTAPDPVMVLMFGFGDYYTRLMLFAWTKTPIYWKTRGELGVMINERLKKEGIDLAIPMQDIRVQSEQETSLNLLAAAADLPEESLVKK